MKTKFFELLVGALLTAGGLCVQAQPRIDNEAPDKPRWTEEEWTQHRAERMASSLMLYEKTEAKFVTLYVQYLKDLKDCRDQCRKDAPEPKRDKVREPREPLTDAEIEKRIEDRFAQQRQLLDIREKYYKDLKKILTPKQLQRIFEPAHRNMNHHRWDRARRPDVRCDHHKNHSRHRGCCW